jgi:hypothetical protein
MPLASTIHSYLFLSLSLSSYYVADAINNDIHIISGCKDLQTSSYVSNVGSFQLPQEFHHMTTNWQLVHMKGLGINMTTCFCFVRLELVAKRHRTGKHICIKMKHDITLHQCTQNPHRFYECLM